AHRDRALRLARLVGGPSGRRSYGERPDLNGSASLLWPHRHDAVVALAQEVHRRPIGFERSCRRFQNGDQFQAGTTTGCRFHSTFDAVDKMLTLHFQGFLLLNVRNVAVSVMIRIMELRKG